MTEPLRTFALSCVQQAQTRVYEGRPFEPWNNPYRHSLPPPPDDPKSKKKVAKKVELASMYVNPYPQLSPRAAAVRMLEDGYGVLHIGMSLNISEAYVSNIKQKLKRGVIKHAQPVPAEPTAVPSVAVAPAVETSEVIASSSPVLPLALVLPVMISRSVSVSTAPRSGTHVLDWQQRMAAYAFDGEPGKGKPKSVKPRKCSSAVDFRSVYPWPHACMPSTINPKHSRAIDCAAPASAPARISPFD